MGSVLDLIEAFSQLDPYPYRALGECIIYSTSIICLAIRMV